MNSKKMYRYFSKTLHLSGIFMYFQLLNIEPKISPIARDKAAKTASKIT